MRIRLGLCAAAAVLLMLPACIVVEDPVLGSTPPADYRQIAADYLRRTFADLAGLRDAMIAEPRPGQVWSERRISKPAQPGAARDFDTVMLTQDGWAVCWRATLDSLRGWDDVLIIRSGIVVAAASESSRNDPRQLCTGVAFMPFPELMAR